LVTASAGAGEETASYLLAVATRARARKAPTSERLFIVVKDRRRGNYSLIGGCGDNYRDRTVISNFIN
jgi:hypothetical protein